MSYGVQCRAADGSIFYDSSVAIGGVVAGVYVYGSGSTATLPFPRYIGRQAQIVILSGAPSATDSGVSVSTSAGYPVVTVLDRPTRGFMLVVW